MLAACRWTYLHVLTSCTGVWLLVSLAFSGDPYLHSMLYIVNTASVETSLETVHCQCHHHFLTQIVPRVDHSVAEEILP